MISNRSFGVELEVGNEIAAPEIGTVMNKIVNPRRPVSVTCGWEQSDNNSYWHVKYDSTCGKPNEKGGKSPGWEIASYVAQGRNELKEISRMAKHLSSSCFVNSNCGFHIHAGVEDFDKEQLGVLLARWIKIEPILCYSVPEHRVNNYYCRLWNKSRKIKKDIKYSAGDLWSLLKPTKYTPHENRQKKVTLNMVSIAGAMHDDKSYKRKTVEFRMPEGTLDDKTIRSWVNFFIGFIDAAKNSMMPASLKSVRSLKTFFEYCNLSNDKLEDFDQFNTKMFLIERFEKYGNEHIKKQIKSNKI